MKIINTMLCVLSEKGFHTLFTYEIWDIYQGWIGGYSSLLIKFYHTLPPLVLAVINASHYF